MDKIRESSKYINTVHENSSFFKKYYFHSLIDLNLVKLDSILKHGILSKNFIERKKIISLYTHDSNSFNSKNGKHYISLTEYHDDCKFIDIFESFSLHTLTCISLLVSKNVPIQDTGERFSVFDDEVFCLDMISRFNIQGILLPEHLSSLFIRQVNSLPNDLSCYTKDYMNHWVDCMEQYFQRKISRYEIQNSLDQLWMILKQYEVKEKALLLAIREQRKRYGKDVKDVLADILHHLWAEKLQISNPRYIDVVMRINQARLPVYEIGQKRLKKLK